jgi:hypothetical protein
VLSDFCKDIAESLDCGLRRRGFVFRPPPAFERIFAALSEDPDFEYALVDATIVKVHRHGQERAAADTRRRFRGENGGFWCATVLYRSGAPILSNVRDVVASLSTESLQSRCLRNRSRPPLRRLFLCKCTSQIPWVSLKRMRRTCMDRVAADHLSCARRRATGDVGACLAMRPREDAVSRLLFCVFLRFSPLLRPGARWRRRPSELTTRPWARTT